MGPTAVITTVILLLMFSNDPHGNGVGHAIAHRHATIPPPHQCRTDVAGLDITLPCDEKGRPL
jgi:hypothetical protein